MPRWSSVAVTPCQEAGVAGPVVVGASLVVEVEVEVEVVVEVELVEEVEVKVLFCFGTRPAERLLVPPSSATQRHGASPDS